MNKWKMNKAGLLNFWYYDEEVFNFSDGKLLLRGSNGSGKSVTMQSFLPVLLDGKTSPDRLDPFGSRARRMEDYLLGEKEIVNRDERTGYLYLEFKREGTEQYITIGIGLQAKRNKQMKFWGFVITDNRRIGKDMELYKWENNAGVKQKIPLSRIELENVIREGGHVVQTKTEYMKLVNKYLFGFETIEAYDDLIKLLIQLRSPKLSKDFKPTVIYEILEAALPPLTDEDLRHLSDTIEQMDQTKQQIEQLERESAAIKSLNQVYHLYNQRILADLANEFIESGKRLTKEQKEYENLTDGLQTLTSEINQLEDEIRDLKIKQQTREKEEERLSKHKIWNLEKELRAEEEELGKENRLLTKKMGQLSEKKAKEQKLYEEKNKLGEQMEERERYFADLFIDMTNDAEESSFIEQHQLNKQDFERHQKEHFDFTVWVKETNQHLSRLENVKDILQKLETIKMKYQDKNKELANEEKALDDVSTREQDWSQLFEEDKQQKLNEIYGWLENPEWLEIPDADLQETSRKVYALYEPTSYESVKEPFKQATLHFERQQGKIHSELKFKASNLDGQLKEKEAELQKWKTMKDPEPDIAQPTKEARQQLDLKGVPYVPFYAAVEFKDNVSPDVQKRIEAAVIDSGLLDALMVEEALQVKHDRVLIPKPQMMAYTLADYLKPDLQADSKISSSLVEAILQSITIDEGEGTTFSINEEGHYQLGLIKGHAVPVEEVRYIGRNARKRFRQQQIESIQTEMEELQAEKRILMNQIKQTETAIREANQRFEQFPDDKDLQESFHQIRTLRLEINHHKKQVERLANEVKEIYSSYLEVKHQVDEQTREMHLEVSLESYLEAIRVVKRYSSDLTNLEKEHIQYVNELKQLLDNQERLEEIVEEIDELQGEINVATDNVERIKQNMHQIEKQLKQQGVSDIRRQIEEVQRALKDIEQALDEKKTLKPRKETEREQVQKELQSKEKQVRFWENMKQTWQLSFEQEINRGFVEVDKDKEIEGIAKAVLKEYSDILKEKERTKLTEQLTKEFYKQQSDLMEYRPNSYIPPIQTPKWMTKSTDEQHSPFIEQWKQKIPRQIIELHDQGKQVSPYTVQKQIEWEQARQESFLDEQDQALYEEILFHSVGQKLRARIRRAEQWVEKMKSLMETRDTSSGLTFSIRWKPRTADSESEMDTVDLVRLLRQDPKLLKEDDLEKITVHFRTKITKAKEMIGDQTELQTLLQVLKEVLDYRKWFSFVLYFQREGENRRELTNNQFYKFSGGEKAMAMYIPLFTACYSRYLEANPDAPYIISLDEAFAGVDENNIREMFEIVEQLGFNYIMNSQVLWGDYDTINELSICELVRPKNADFVSVIRYHWDGNKMEVEVPLEDRNETLV